MIRPLFKVVFVLMTWPVAVAAADQDADRPLQIFCAAGLSQPITVLAQQFESQTGHRVLLNFASSGALARQIEAGAPADLFLSAAPNWLDWLGERQALNAASTFDIAGNRLALIALAPAVGETSELLATASLIAVGDPDHVPVGRYAQQALMNMNLWQPLQGRLVMARDVRSVTRYVRIDEADLGIVYATEAVADPSVHIVALLPAELHQPIIYSGAVVAGSTQFEAAAKFAALLTADEGRRAFAEAGFLVNGQRADLGNVTAAPAASSKRASIWPAFWISAKVSLLATLLVIPPGIACGWVLARRNFFGKSVLEAIVYFPLVTPPVVVGYLALIVLGRNGPIGQLLDSLGLRIAFTWYGAAIAAGIMAFPLLVRSVRVAMELVDRKIEQAAGTLGASPWRVALTVTMPLAGGGIAGGIVLALARSFGEFGATIALAGNIDQQTRTVPLAIYSALQTPGGDHAAMQLATLSMVIAMAALIGSEWMLRRARALAGEVRDD